MTRLGRRLATALLLLGLPALAGAVEIVDLSGADGASLAFGRLSEAMNAWRSGLEGARDDWGNLRSAGYVSAARPDHLSAAQLDFLKTWYDERPEAGIRIARTALECSALHAALAAEEEAARLAEAARTAAAAAARDDEAKTSSTEETDGDGASATEDGDAAATATDDPATSDEESAASEDTPDLAEAASTEEGASSSAAGEHRASFLFDDARTRAMNILSPRCPDGDFRAVLGRMVDNGDTVAYLFLANEGDGGWAGYSPYGSAALGGAVDEATVAHMRARLTAVREAGLKPILWLRADDSPTLTGASMDEQTRFHADAVRLFDGDCAGWVVGLELDEGFSSSEIRALTQDLKKRTKKEVGVHFTSLEKVDLALASGADVFYGQYGFGHSPDEIEKATRSAVATLDGRMRFIAAEYHKSADGAEAKALGQAAMRGGAAGTGNGR